MRSNCIVPAEVKQLSPKSFKGVLFLSGPILPCVVLPSVPSGSGLAWIYGRWGAGLATLRFWAYFISANPMEWMDDLLHLHYLLLALWIRLRYNLYARPLLWSALTSGFSRPLLAVPAALRTVPCECWTRPCCIRRVLKRTNEHWSSCKGGPNEGHTDSYLILVQTLATNGNTLSFLWFCSSLQLTRVNWPWSCLCLGMWKIPEFSMFSLLCSLTKE